jgi:phosphomannomutase
MIGRMSFIFSDFCFQIIATGIFQTTREVDMRTKSANILEFPLSLKFGTSGLRGLSVDLAGPPAALYATAFAQYLLAKGWTKPGDEILVGRDFRDSSPEIARICMESLAAVGLSPVNCGTVPTPALALYGLSQGSASLMITGSHIPAERNGIKFYRPDGEIDKQDEQAIVNAAAALVADGWTYKETAHEAPNRQSAVESLYLARNRALLPKDALRGKRIGVYQHSTVSRDLFVDILAHYGADVVALGRSDSFIPVDTEAVSSETVNSLKAWAEKFRLDAIVSADGDGDRPLLADETGAPLRGDLLGVLSARFLQADHVVTPVTSNSGLETSGSYKVTRTKVGSPFVIAGMQDAMQVGADTVMGFEANGGLLTATDFMINGSAVRALPTRDCVLPCLAALYISAEAKLPLSKLVMQVNLPYALSDRLENYAVERSAALMGFLRASSDNLRRFLEPVGHMASFSDIDGLRVTLTDGRILHFRPSGNAPEMRCYVETGDLQSAQTLLQNGLAMLNSWT